MLPLYSTESHLLWLFVVSNWRARKLMPVMKNYYKPIEFLLHIRLIHILISSNPYTLHKLTTIYDFIIGQIKPKWYKIGQKQVYYSQGDQCHFFCYEVYQIDDQSVVIKLAYITGCGPGNIFQLLKSWSILLPGK